MKKTLIPSWDTLKRNSLFMILALLSIMIVSLCFQDTINYDEYFSMQWCRFDWNELMQQLMADVHPPLYYILLKPVVDLTHENMFFARMLSAIAAIALLWAGGLFLKRFFGIKSAVFFVIFFYMNPFMIQKATEIRMYPLASVFTVISGILAYYLLQNPTRKTWILFTIFSLLSAYTHYYALLCMVFLYVGVLAYFAFTPPPLVRGILLTGSSVPLPQ